MAQYSPSPGGRTNDSGVKLRQGGGVSRYHVIDDTDVAGTIACLSKG
jgi:hypothetical protein